MRKKKCPLCGKTFVAPGKQYCEVCRKLSYSVHSKRLREKAEAEKQKRQGQNAFAELVALSKQINWRYVRGCGIVSKQPAPPPKREIALSDFIDPNRGSSLW